MGPTLSVDSTAPRALLPAVWTFMVTLFFLLSLSLGKGTVVVPSHWRPLRLKM